MAKYKDSGVEWLGAIPEDWSVTKLKYIADLLTAKSTNSDDLFVGLENISSGDGKYISKEENIADGASVSFEKNDVLFGKLRPYLAKSWLAAFSGVCSSEFLVLRTAKLHPKYLNYYSLTNEFIEQVNSSTYGSKMPRASWEFIGLLPVPTCSYSLSEKVACFLDHETAKIDNLIEKQQQLIELLKEKRQAVISHAVTKGLNPDVPMKDSGVEWLGEVPEHWTIKPLRYLGDCQNGINIGAEAFGSGFPFVSYGDAYKNRVLPENGSGLVQSTAEDRRKYSLLRGDVLFTRTSETIEEIGFASACIKSIENACFAGFLIRFRPKSSDLCIEYSKYYFSNQLLRIFFTKEMNLITRASLSQDLLKTMPVVIPPVDEQIKIAELLDSISEKFDQLQLLGEEQIKYLQERRTALISAAVTGKIDVRDWVAPDTQDAEEPEEASA